MKKEEKKTFTVNIQAMKKDGSFPCPSCGKILDPSDETNDNYVVIKPKTLGSIMDGVTLLCKSCNSTIKLNFKETKK